MSINKQVDIVYPYHRRLLRNKREQNIDTYNRIDEPQKNYAVQKKKKKTKECIFHDCHLCEILRQAKLASLDRKQISGWLGMRMIAIDCKGAWGDR